MLSGDLLFERQVLAARMPGSGVLSIVAFGQTMGLARLIDGKPVQVGQLRSTWCRRESDGVAIGGPDRIRVDSRIKCEPCDDITRPLVCVDVQLPAVIEMEREQRSVG